MNMVTLHFGEFKGMSIDEVPSDYLKWLTRKSEDDDIVQAAEDELSLRDDNHSHFYQY